MDLSKQEIHQVSTRGQQRTREEAALHAPWSTVDRPAVSFSRTQTWEAPGLQATTRPPDAYVQIRGSSHPSGGCNSGPGCDLVELAVDFSLHPPMLYAPGNPGATVVMGSWGLRALKSRAGQPSPCRCVPLLHCVEVQVTGARRQVLH